MNKICVKLEIEGEKYKKFETIAEKSEDNLSNIINKIIEKTIKDNNVDWIKGNICGEVRSKDIKAKKAIQCFREKGYHNISQYNTTFATKNTNNNCYWLNPDKRHLHEDWYIILNDCNNKRLYLLYVPKNSIEKLKMRNDRICNVSIGYNDLDFLDIHSGVKFRKYFSGMLEYDSLIL